MKLVRGRVYAVIFDHIASEGEKFYLVVSNNERNRRLGSALAVRLTTSPKPSLSSIIELDHREVFAGRVLCDDITVLYTDEARRDLGPVTPGAMAKVGAGLRAALGLADA